jgi:hypothetical protein
LPENLKNILAGKRDDEFCSSCLNDALIWWFAVPFHSVPHNA